MNATPYEMATNLLDKVWLGTDKGYKKRYVMNIWEQFQNTAKACAYTSKLTKFINDICCKLNATPGLSHADREEIEQILNANQDRAILKSIRDETTALVLEVRLRNQDRKDAYTLAQEGKQRDYDALDADELADEIYGEINGEHEEGN